MAAPLACYWIESFPETNGRKNAAEWDPSLIKRPVPSLPRDGIDAVRL